MRAQPTIFAGEDEPRKLSKATKDRIREAMESFAWDRGPGQLSCVKCGEALGSWAGRWSWLEGSDHPTLSHIVARHVCNNLTPVIQ